MKKLHQVLLLASFIFCSLIVTEVQAKESLKSGETLQSGHFLESSNNQYRIYLQGDGNLVVRSLSTGDALWSSNTHRESGVQLVMQGDGNLVLYTSTATPVWDSKTNGLTISEFKIMNNGALFLLSNDQLIKTIYEGVKVQANQLLVNESLSPNEYIESLNGNFRLQLQNDGNLVLRNVYTTQALWSSSTQQTNGIRLTLQGDGNLVLYTPENVPLWDSKTNGQTVTDLSLTNSGSLVLYNGSSVIRAIYTAQSKDTVDSSTLNNKIMAGYQGWFNAQGDGANRGWRHWSNRSGNKPDANNITIDMWPDLREYDRDELFDTSFYYSNSENAGLYSAFNKKTVERHVKWMQDYGLDGVFVQRFIGEALAMRNMRDKVLNNIRSGSEKYGRVFANMYDISGGNSRTLVNDIKNDWMHLVDTLKVTQSDRYLKHKGRPVLSIWGFGVRSEFSPSQANELVNWFTRDAPVKYRVTLKFGVDHKWRDHSPAWQNVYQKLDIISPWTVGRYRTSREADNFRNSRIEPDYERLRNTNIDYMPVVFPGFSWWNLKGEKFNYIRRYGGRFFWRQIFNTIDTGCSMIYIAMFDEVDEGTAIFKVAENASQTPTRGRFVTLDQDGEALPSDWYLKLAGEAGKILRNEIPLTPTIPIQP
ncbi:hypothetical protein [Pleionea sediminis]|uniref:hypothetical protein n=1 Tax=Pleionea sediminis TaxID=2569479 RepID=UPI001184CED2|nr:hypothetical protein [Pleionea sediminis]